MIRVRLLDILQKDERSLNWLAKKANLNYSSLHKFANNQTSSVSFDILYKICKTLDVDISDIFEIVD